jgi:hypothetical protein
LGNGGRVECVGLKDIGTGSKEIVVDRGDHVGPGQCQKVVITGKVLGPVREALAAEIRLVEPMRSPRSAAMSCRGAAGRAVLGRLEAVMVRRRPRGAGAPGCGK